MGKLGDVKVPDGPCKFDPHVFTVTEEEKNENIYFTHLTVQNLQACQMVNFLEIIQRCHCAKNKTRLKEISLVTQRVKRHHGPYI